MFGKKITVDSSAHSHVSKCVRKIERRSVSWSNPLRIIIHPMTLNSLTHTEQTHHTQNASETIVGKWLEVSETATLHVAVISNVIMSLGTGIMRDAVWNEAGLYHRSPLRQNIRKGKAWPSKTQTSSSCYFMATDMIGDFAYLKVLSCLLSQYYGSDREFWCGKFTSWNRNVASGGVRNTGTVSVC